MKKLVAFVMAVITLLAVSLPALTASAAVSWPSLSKSAYCEFTAEKKISVYQDMDCEIRGTSSPKAAYDAYIAKKDVCRIYKITSSYVYLAYPTSSGYKYGYIKRSTLFNVSAPSESVKSKGKVTTYKAANTSSEYGYVAKGDKVYKVGTSGNYIRIIYQAASGNRAYKLAYVTTSKYNNSVNGNVWADVTKNFAGKKINIKSVENGKYLCADADVKNIPVFSNRSSASTWETFTVTKLTDDGWVGLKANSNGKYLSVNNDSDSKSVYATASKVQSWECFRIYQKGSDYYIKAQSNNQWLSVRTDENGSPVRACVSKASTWERFKISVVQNNSTTSATMSSKSNSSFDPIWPCKSSYKVTCLYYYSDGRNHGSRYGYKKAMDIAGGGDILAVESGTVITAKNLGNSSFGKYVEIKHSNGKISLYAHLKSYNVSVGDKVTKGQKIGVMGNSGNSTGTHLHFEISDSDPYMNYYKDKYMNNISFEKNVYSNNKKYNSDRSICNVINANYKLSNGWYYIKNK